MLAAITWMPTVFAEVEENLKRAERYAAAAAGKGARLIVFPEFFTTGFALNEKMMQSILASDEVEKRLLSLSQRYGIAIGGSYLHYDSEKEEVFNTYGLFFPG